jgi:hypothetical protein
VSRQRTWTAVDDYFNGLLVEEDHALLAAVEDSAAATPSGWAVPCLRAGGW